MATVTITPNPARHGQALTLDGTGFLPSTKCNISVPEFGFSSDIVSDVSGEVSSVDLADHAFQTLTSDGTIPTANDTVTVGNVTYTFKASVSTTANEVLLGANAAAALTNLKAAINLAAGSGTLYGSSTVINPDVGAGALTATTLVVFAKVAGTGGNSLATTETSTHLSYGAGTMASGAVATGYNIMNMIAETVGTHTVTITDGTTTTSTTVVVFSE